MTTAVLVDRTNFESFVERDQRVLAELPQVYYLAARIRERMPQTVELRDLVQAGVIGLIEAIQNYDSAKDARFSTFAKFRIRGAILDSLRKTDWASRKIRRHGRAIALAVVKLGATLGRVPLQEEIALHMQLDLDELQRIMAELDGLCLVGQFGNSSSRESEIYDLIESAQSTGLSNPFELCLEGQRKHHLVKAVSNLSKKEQLILSLYYKEGLTMREIAQVVECAVSRISQIHSTALLKLRKSLGYLRANSTDIPVGIVGAFHPSVHKKAFMALRRTHDSAAFSG